MTSRERVLAVIDGRIPDRLPFNFWMDRNLMSKMDEELGFDFRINHYGADVIETFPDIDWFFGNKMHAVSDDITTWQTSSAISDIEELKNIVMPDPKDPRLCEYMRYDRKRAQDKALFALLIHPLEVFFTLRLLEQAFLDLYDNPDEVEAFLYRLSDFQAAYVPMIKQSGCDVLYVAGDISSSKGPMLSEDMLRRFCFEPLKPIIKAAKSVDLPVFFHTDGRMDGLFDLFVEYGIDGINPLQPHLNDIPRFKRKYGDKLKLYGGIDNCFAIPDGSAEDVRRHIRELFETMGKDGGLIASSHDIPHYVPRENIDTMADELKKCVY